MISKINSITVNWLESNIIEVEVDINQGLPAFTIVWLPDQWVQESRERLRSALKSSNTKLPTSRIVVNLAPANIKKSWPSFDLAIAIAILHNMWDIIENKYISDSIFLWELALDWKLRKVSWVLPATIWAKQNWFKRIFLPRENVLEASIIPGIDVVAIDSLYDLIQILNLEKVLEITEKLDFNEYRKSLELENKFDFKYIVWQKQAKRALEIAAAWGHNIIMSWPPWSGKTMLSNAFATILPDLTIDEAIEISKIYSISGLLDNNNPIIKTRPFRTVHHTASAVSIIWGWRNAKPWEISLAHKWVLFLDEILEFNKSVLEVLRQPLEDGNITVTRVNASFEYPAKFSLVWAMNPCPCGYLTDPDKECICSSNQIKNYRAKLSWPLIDRVDIFIEVPKVKTEDFKIKDNYDDVEDSKTIKQRVEKARKIQQNRFKNTPLVSNSEMTTKQINTYCKLDLETTKVLKQAVTSLNLSARAYYRVIKLARTIADLDWVEDIKVEHILEALSYRKSEENI